MLEVYIACKLVVFQAWFKSLLIWKTSLASAARYATFNLEKQERVLKTW